MSILEKLITLTNQLQVMNDFFNIKLSIWILLILLFKVDFINFGCLMTKIVSFKIICSLADKMRTKL